MIDKQYRQLLLAMTKIEIKARYKNAFFGLLWMLAFPLLQVLVIGFIFQYFINITVDNYYLFLLSGLLPWNFVTGSISLATESIVNERNIVHKAPFPLETIPLSIVFSQAFHLVVVLLLMLIAAIIYNLTLPQSILLIVFLPLGVVWLIGLSIGISLLVSSLQVRFRDIKFIVQMSIMLFFYATPILYSWTNLPSGLHRYLALNPFVTPFEILRLALLSTSLPPWSVISGNLLLTIVIVWLGITVFRHQKPTMSDWI